MPAAAAGGWKLRVKSDIVSESKTVFQATAELQNEIAKTAANDNYSRKMKDLVTGSDEVSDHVFENSYRYAYLRSYASA